MHSICVLFGTNAVAYNVASAFKDSEYEVCTILPKGANTLFSYSSFWNDVHRAKHAIDDSRLVDDIIEYIQTKKTSGKILTFLTNDQAVYFWIKNQDRLSKYLSVQIENIEECYNKNLFFKKIGIETFCPRTSDIAEVKQFPCVVKPAYKDSENRFYKKFKNKVKFVDDSEGLKKFSEFSPGELVCQEFLEFELGGEFSFWAYRSPKGKIWSFVGRHMSKYPDKTGRVSHTKLVENSEVKKIGEKVLEHMNYVGIADVQIIFDQRSKTYKVIEMNPRMWCSHEVLLMNGINVLKLSADNFYGAHKTFEPNMSKGQEWYSSLYSIDHKFPMKKNTEFYQMSSDNLFMRSLIALYLRVKYLYYRFSKL